MPTGKNTIITVAVSTVSKGGNPVTNSVSMRIDKEIVFGHCVFNAKIFEVICTCARMVRITPL